MRCVACRSITRLNVSHNGLCAAEADLLARSVSDHPIMTELNVSGNSLSHVHTHEHSPIEFAGVRALGKALSTMGALHKFVFGSVDIYDPWCSHDPPVVIEAPTTLVNAKFHGCLDASDAVLLAGVLSRCRYSQLIACGCATWLCYVAASFLSAC